MNLYKKTNSVFLDAILLKALERPDKIAIEMVNGNKATYREIIENTINYSAQMSVIGIKEGDRIITKLKNSLEYVYFILACMNCGAIYSPLLENFTGEDNKAAIEKIKPKYFLVDHEYKLHDNKIKTINIKSFAVKENYDSEIFLKENSYTGLFRMLWSSGSSGFPKIIKWRQDKLLFERLRWNSAIDVNSQDIFFCRHTLNVAHATDLHLFSSLLSGSKLILCLSDESQVDINRYLEKYKPTIMSALPYHYKILADTNVSQKFDYIKNLCVGGLTLARIC